jgi:hypothetical protein
VGHPNRFEQQHSILNVLNYINCEEEEQKNILSIGAASKLLDDNWFSSFIIPLKTNRSRQAFLSQHRD